MLRMSKLTDYGTVVLARLATCQTLTPTASLATTTRLPLPTVRKILKALAAAGLVVSERGASGGYRLSRAPEAISAADILAALEGPLQLTACSSESHDCQLEPTCAVGSSWQRINGRIRAALAAVSLAELIRDVAPGPKFEQRLRPLAEINVRTERQIS